MMTQKSVLTLVADHTAQSSIRNIADAARETLIEAGADCAQPDWLSEDRAVDIAFDGLARDAAQDGFAKAGLLETIDFCLQPAEFRRKKLFLADMDSTIITVECIDELADFAGFRAEVSAITERAMNGELDFNEAFRARVAMLKGLREEILQQVFDERVTLTPGARTLVQTMRSTGTYTALVSGGFTFFTSRVRETVGFHMDMSNELLFEDGALTGVAAEPILNSAAKLNTLESLRHEYSLRREETAAIGDGANDIPMIEAAGLGVAFHAKAKAAAAADATIRFGDLTTLLYYQGYRQSEFGET
ncbi:phosphoserine phosphatase SerB [Sneathiella sp.]|uniref:phosphoserine phosphatase SerB n=1 Tax=Sneathiella sp. TaxID=1964365 RepID=UPI00260F0F75|nr:phosphoserine phosphatase SerB [Sneathiella sp.]MDF2368948.1 phosphoserine phosphatase SerB [Sneathiella sp.]